MLTLLDETEVRVLAALVEKQITTPDYYPLTLNALTLACNQKNNRHPVTALTDAEVESSVERLRAKNLAYVYYGSTSRVPKYKHVMPEVYHLDGPELAVLCVLMLRGPQTVSELRERGSRLYTFLGAEEVEAAVDSLLAKDPDVLVARLPRQPGQKETRVAHLLSGSVSLDQLAAVESARDSGSTRQGAAERIQLLEQQVEVLTLEVNSLKLQFVEFKQQFE